MLTDHLIKARRMTATRANRERQQRAELRLDEIVKVAGIADTYEMVDRAGDLNVETHFGRLWQAAESEHMRTIVAQAFAAWQHDERIEELAVRGEVDEAVAVLKANNDYWLGSFVPDDEGPAA